MLNKEVLKQLTAYKLDGTEGFLSNYEGERKSRQKGQSQEFSDFRPYVAGDDIRLIDWNVYGRTDTYQIKLFEEEREARVTIVLDHSASMGHEGSKVTMAKKLTLMLGYVALAAGDGVRLLTWHEGSGFMASSFFKGLSQYHDLQRLVEDVNWSSNPNFESLFHTVNFTKGVTIWISDLLYEGFEAIHKQAKYHRQHLLMLHLLSDETLEPTIDGMYELEDSESGALLEVKCSQTVLEAYHQAMIGHMEAIQQVLSKNGDRYVLLNVDKEEEHHVLKKLLAHSILR
jgi:hypothetical protein